MSTKEEDNFLRILHLYKKIATPALRNYFDSLHPNLASVLSSNKSTVLDLYQPPPHRKKILNKAQWNTLYPPSGHAVTSADLDLTLMVCLLRNLPPTVSPPVDGFDVLPRSSDTSDGAQIARIQFYKDRIVSISKDGKLSDNDFKSIWNDLEKVTYGLGNQQDVKNVADAKTKVLDYESAKRFINLDDIKLETGDIEKNRKRLHDHADGPAEQPNKMAKLETGISMTPITVNIHSQEYTDTTTVKGIKEKLTLAETDDKKKDFNFRNKIPEQITKMDKESINIYLKALETGSERRHDINLVIVGKKGAGKTSLVRRLFGEHVGDFKSTNGIEIDRRRCRISQNNWEWNKIPDTTEMKESSINNRLLKSMVKEVHQGRENENIYTFETSSLDMLESDENEENKGITATSQVTQQLHDPQCSSAELLTISESTTASHSSEIALQILSSIIRPDLDLQDEDNHATLTVWDFAGDKEFYNTHQMFFNSEAIYLVVANMADIENTETHGTFKFWMDNIHWYSSKSEKPREFGGRLNPAVIVVGTHMDTFEEEGQCRELLASYINEKVTDSYLHLRSTHLISNTNDQEDKFKNLRNDIFATANESANWNREYPVKFIQIEQALNLELTNGRRIISFRRVKELGSNSLIPISNDKEIRLFLRYQHEFGNLIYFEDIPSYIILDPLWLAHASKCIVTADEFHPELPYNYLEWNELKQTGKMDLKLLEAIFKRQSEEMIVHKEHILEILEKFDILSRPLLLTDSGQKETGMYVPCMIEKSKIEDIDKVCNVPNWCKSTCLCFVFRFLPPPLIDNLFVSCLQEYPLAAVKGQLCIFHNCFVFDVSKTGNTKFVLAKSNHTIELQVWQWGKVNLMKNQDVLQFIEMEINRIVHTRYKLKTVSFEKKWKCETTSYSYDDGFHELDGMQDGEYYYCEEHATVHKYEDHWSGEKTKTKVPVEITEEQRNFTRLSMVVLDILHTVLYDRLDLDKQSGQLLSSCGQYDIISLYQEHRKLNIHIPSKGRWGGGRTVYDIPPNETCIGDDIERIRLIRNEMLHSTVFTVSDTRYQSLITITQNMLIRFDNRNNSTGDSYVKRLDEIRKMELKTNNLEENLENIKTELRQKLDIQLPWLVDADEFQRMLSVGEFISYENRLSLGGPCRVGKSALASVLIGTEIPQQWDSTDGLVIYFGRNGIDIAKKKMVPLKEGERGHDVLAKLLRRQPEIYEKSNQIIGQKTTTHAFRTSFAVETNTIVSKSSPKGEQICTRATRYSEEFAIQTCSSITEHAREHMSDKIKYSAIDEKQLLECQKLELKPHILEEVKNGQYRIEIAPSDLIDFGGQKSYDMTHQLFIQHSGSFVLMFDGRFGLKNPLKEYSDGVTAASILIHWVDSILTYSEDTEHIMPMILFAATHRDLCKGNTAEMKKSFTSEIEKIFSKHEKSSHIYLDTVYFINSKDDHDEEIQHMTDQVVIFAMKQPTWGQRRPMQWVPLELQISNIRTQNVNIITKDDLRNVNKLNNDLELTDPQLDDFLLVQHSLGKLMHYNIRGLDNFIIIHPPVLVNILKSFVTDEKFFPKDEKLKSILQTLTETGKIYKTGLLKLWDQNENMLNDAIKEFVIELLVHLDILIIPETNKNNRSTAELFIVPCMIKTEKPSNFIDFESLKGKTICLKYSLARQSIPSSLAYKIIGTTLNVWPLKEEGSMSCIYHKAAVLDVVDNNELRLWVEDNMIQVYITNQTSSLAISPDITASIQECLTRNLELTLEFYYKSFCGQFKHAKLAELFSMEVGIPCGNSVCYISLEKAKTVESWKCDKNNEEHRTSRLLYWIFDRVPETCASECKGKTKEELEIQPSDKHLVRFGNYFEYASFEDCIIDLGMRKHIYQKIKDKYGIFGNGGILSIALIQWKETMLSDGKTPTMKSLSDALVTSELDSHIMCEILREERKLLDDTNPNLQKTPTVKALEKLSLHMGNCALELGIELGLEVGEIEQISVRHKTNLPKLIKGILLKWKRKSNVETVRCLLMALERVEKGGFNCLKNMLKDSTMLEEKTDLKYFSDCYEKTKDQRGLAFIVNYSAKRKGSDEDVRRLENFFFKELGYKVKCAHDLNKKDLMDNIDSFKREEMTGKAGKKYHCFVFVMMCHGKKDNLRLCGKDVVKVEKIVDKFKFSDFAGKPKYFIFQACRRELEKSYIHADDPDTIDDKAPHRDTDILQSFATTPGYKAYRKPLQKEDQWVGAWFIHALLEVFENRYKDSHVMEMLQVVRQNFNDKADYKPKSGKRQMSADVTMLTKNFYL